MAKYEITNSKTGHSFGTYEASNPEAAITAMMADAGSDEEPSSDLVAVEVEDES